VLIYHLLEHVLAVTYVMSTDVFCYVTANKEYLTNVKIFKCLESAFPEIHCGSKKHVTYSLRHNFGKC